MCLGETLESDLGLLPKQHLRFEKSGRIPETDPHSSPSTPALCLFS